MPDPIINLMDALAEFDDIYRPRIIGVVNDYDVRLAHVKGDHVWHVHDTTDEFFLVLQGEFHISLREVAGERTVILRQNDVFIVPKGLEHKPSSPGGSILMLEPSGTPTTGDRHEEALPAHVITTVGQEL